jgi:PPP family 3-phenylpropionic acid transporter
MENNHTEQESGKGQVLALASLYFLHYATLGIIFPFTGYFFKQIGFSGTEIGLYLAIFPLMKFTATNLWTSNFAKSEHKRLFMGLAILISSTSLVPMYFSTNKILIAVLLVIFAGSRAGVIPVLDTITIGLDKKIAYGRIRLFGSLGFLATSIIAGILMDKFGIFAFIWAFMGAGVLCTIPVSFLNFRGSMFSKKEKSELKLPPELIIFFTAMTIYLVSFSFLSNFFNIKVAESGFSQTWAGNMWAIGVIAETFFLFFQNRVLSLFKVRTIIAASIFLAGVRYLVTGHTDSLFLLCFFSAFHGFGYGTFHIGVMRYFRDYVPERMKLKAQSIYSGFGYGLGSIIGSMLSGVLYDFSGLKGVFTFAFVLCVVSAIIILTFTGREKPEQAV